MSDGTENTRSNPDNDPAATAGQSGQERPATPTGQRPNQDQYSHPGGQPYYQPNQASQYPTPGQYTQPGQYGQREQGAQWWSQQQPPHTPADASGQGQPDWGYQQPGGYRDVPYGSQTTTLERPRRAGRGKLAAGALALALVAGGVGGGIVAVFDGTNSAAAPAALAQSASTQPVATAPDGTVQSVAQAVLPSVVQIQVVVNGSGGEGSGVVLSADGFILTNNHVVQEAAGAPDGAITVAFSDGSTATGSIVGRDPSADIAVIKVDKAGLTPIRIGSSGSLAVGQNVVAVGSPLGLAGTVTTGIVSALNRPVSASGQDTSQDQSSVLDAIQTDAAINPGNSGGALVNLNGELIGVNSAIASLGAAQSGGQSGSIGLGFAIPIDQANRIAQELIQNGVATQAVLGVSVTGARDVRGATVGEVTPDGAAAQAGIESGAVITKIDDRVIADSESLVAAVRSYAPGSTVQLQLQQRGSESTKTVTLGSQTVGTR